MGRGEGNLAARHVGSYLPNRDQTYALGTATEGEVLTTNSQGSPKMSLSEAW